MAFTQRLVRTLGNCKLGAADCKLDYLQTEEYEEVDGLDSRLRGLASPGSDDEHESMFSGMLSDNEEHIQPHIAAARGASPPHTESRAGSRSLP